MGYAEGTSVPSAKTRGEIEAIVEKYGASEFSSGWMNEQAAIQFVASGRRVRFMLSLPSLDEAKEKAPRGRRDWEPAPEAKVAAWKDAETRRRWRCLLLAIKAKLEVVNTGIATFDEEFLAHIVVDDTTIYERILKMDNQGNGPRLLGAAPTNVVDIKAAK